MDFELITFKHSDSELQDLNFDSIHFKLDFWAKNVTKCTV